MTTVGSLSTDLGPGKTNMAADDDNADNLAAAPIDGAGPVDYLQAVSKLDMEPNPFEQSFSGTATGNGESSTGTGETPKPILPPIASMSGRLAPSSDQFSWDEPSLRMGPLSPSMLEGPQDPIMFEKPAANAINSFPTTTAPISTIFNPGASNAENAFPFVGISGVQTTEPYPQAMYNQQQPMPQHPPQHGASARAPQPFPHANGQATMNDRYMPQQGPQHPDNANGYGNLHLLSQATQRDMWIKRESIDSGGHTPHSQAHHPQQPQQQHHQHQQHQSHPPPQNGQSGQGMPGMQGMVGAQQTPKNGAESGFAKGAQRNRMTSEDNSDDSEMSRQSSNSNEKSNKKRSASDDKMDEEEKRKNFLERNRQAALKCRQRKKQWLSNLQAKVEYLTTDNEHLQTQTASLRDEIIHLKALLLAHKDCAVAQANGVYADTINVPNNHNHNHNHNHNGGGMLPHGRAPAHMMQGQPPQQQQQRGPGPRGSLPAQMQTGGARMSISSTAGAPGSTVSSGGMNGQASIRY
ncbi:hypothetical protein EDD21DRAFT_190614 [Dissophora ornata]|nr:hypothetical protein EDD21DRAFT_190614 [Dissophora ornata]